MKIRIEEDNRKLPTRERHFKLLVDRRYIQQNTYLSIYNTDCSLLYLFVSIYLFKGVYILALISNILRVFCYHCKYTQEMLLLLYNIW